MNPDDVVQYLSEHADFFERHPNLLDRLNVPHPQSGQAISLIERQSIQLRERIRALEAKLAEMVHHGRDNDAIVAKLVQWSAALLSESDAAKLPAVLLAELQRLFDVPRAAIRIWGVAPDYALLEVAQPVGPDALRLAASMQTPFCGANVGFEVAGWLAADGGEVASLAILPLRVATDQEAFGLMVMGSPDRDRFQITMGTAFLARIAELATAAMTRLRA